MSQQDTNIIEPYNDPSIQQTLTNPINVNTIIKNKHLTPYARMNNAIKSKLRSSNARSNLVSFLAMMILYHIFTIVSIVIEFSYVSDTIRSKPSNENDKKFISKNGWFIIFTIHFVLSVLWYFLHRYYVIEYNTIIEKIHYDGTTKVKKQNLSRLNLFYSMNIAMPLNPSIKKEDEIIQYNRYIYSNIVIINLSMAISMFVILSLASFSNRINQERFKDYLNIYIIGILFISGYSFFIYARRNK